MVTIIRVCKNTWRWTTTSTLPAAISIWGCIKKRGNHFRKLQKVLLRFLPFSLIENLYACVCHVIGGCPLSFSLRALCRNHHDCFFSCILWDSRGLFLAFYIFRKMILIDSLIKLKQFMNAVKDYSGSM